MTPAPSPSPRAPAAQSKAGRIALRSAISLALLLLLISQIHLGETIAVVAQARTDLLALLFLAILADRILSAYPLVPAPPRCRVEADLPRGGPARVRQ